MKCCVSFFPEKLLTVKVWKNKLTVLKRQEIDETVKDEDIRVDSIDDRDDVDLLGKQLPYV